MLGFTVFIYLLVQYAVFIANAAINTFSLDYERDYNYLLVAVNSCFICFEMDTFTKTLMIISFIIYSYLQIATV